MERKINGLIDLNKLLAAVQESQTGMSDIGFCLACGAEHYQVESDARNYACDECEESQVFGAEEILIMHVA